MVVTMDSAKREYGLRQEASAAQSHSAPVDNTDGVDISGFSASDYKPQVTAVYLDKVTGSGDLTVPAGAYVCGYDEGASTWRRLGDLNSGSAITLTDDIGWEDTIVNASAFSRLAVVAGDTGASTTYKYGFLPILTAG